MGAWKNAARDAMVSGTLASVLSAVVMSLAGKLERDAPAGPVNGPSQWIFSRRAAHRRSFSLRHTLTGFLIHQAMATGWALLHERVFGQSRVVQPASRIFRNAAITAAVANVVDYQLTPRRLQPGFDAQLSRKSLFGIYVAFGLGLALYDLAKTSRRTSSRPRPDSRMPPPGKR
jgi:hypothetical protein